MMTATQKRELDEQQNALSRDGKSHVVILRDRSFLSVSEFDADQIKMNLALGRADEYIKVDGRLIRANLIDRVESYQQYEESQKRSGKIQCVRGHWHFVGDQNMCVAERTSLDLFEEVQKAFEPVNMKVGKRSMALGFITGLTQSRKSRGLQPPTKEELPSWVRPYA